MHRRLIIDGQVFQTAAWHRGMGKYSLELLAALDDLNQKHHYWQSLTILFTDKFPKDPEMLQSLKKRVPHLKIATIDLLPNEIGNKSIPVRNREVVDAYIANVPDINNTTIDFLVLSLLQGEIFPTYPTHANVNKILLYYDLIPLMFHKIYLGNPITRTEYFSKFDELLRADKYLSISQTGANDLSLCLGVHPDRIVNVDGGPIDHSSAAKKLAIPKPFILMPTGNDLRKNNRRGIIGFNQFNQKHNNKYTLVITSYFKDFEVEELSKLAPNVVFSGNISGEELNYLYEETDALLFPTEYEGLGLPNLEAAGKNKPIACSDIAVFREMTHTDFVYFNPRRPAEIAEALEKVTSKDYKINTEGYKELLGRYTWKNTAKIAAQSILSTKHALAAPGEKIAIFGPDPSADVGVGRHMQEAHAELRRYYRPEYFIEGRQASDELRVNFLPYITRVADTTKNVPLAGKGYKAIVYNIYDGVNSQSTIFTALAVPGIAILHDTALQNVWEVMAADGGLLHQSRLALEEQIDNAHRVDGTSHLVSLIARQKAIVVFTEDAKDKVAQIIALLGASTPVYVVQVPATELVYDEILPQKEKSAGCVVADTQDGADLVGDTRLALYRSVMISALDEASFTAVESTTEAEIVAQPTTIEYVDAVSRLELLCASASSSLSALVLTDGLKFGTVPVLTEGSASIDLPEGSVITAKDKEITATIVAEKRSAARKQAKNHSYRAYAKALAEIIATVAKQESKEK